MVEHFLYPISNVKDNDDPYAKFKIFNENKDENPEKAQGKIKLGNNYAYQHEVLLYREDLERELMQTKFHDYSF